MKIYTKKGDQGETSLFGGQRVSKSSCRIDTYGTVDEVSDQVDEMLHEVQKQLFILGADLASPYKENENVPKITQQQVTWLEQQIDQLQDQLPELKNFILPGGSIPGANLHLARTVCRRAERKCVRCKEEALFSEHTVSYLNRLSDFLFVAARYENDQRGNREEIWKSP
jgi:cob(I)alamin adenosyltransferase